MSRVANLKQIKTREKVISFIKKNHDIIDKYGSFEALKAQSNTYRSSHCNQFKSSYNEYKSYIRRKKFIEENFHLYAPSNNTVHNEQNLNETESSVVTHDENVMTTMTFSNVTRDNNEAEDGNAENVNSYIRNTNEEAEDGNRDNRFTNDEAEDGNHDTGHTNDEAEDGNHDTGINVADQNNNNQSNSNNNRGSQNEILSYEESFNLKCHNCKRKQCRNLIDEYGSFFRMEMLRYVFYYIFFNINTFIHFLIFHLLY
jgi:hypothetical protein